jgi:Xaa-Pro aminopeptidase
MASSGEIVARIARLRGVMDEQGLDVVVIAGNTEFQQKGYIRYFADWRMFGGTAYVVVPRRHDPVLVMGLGAQAEWAKELSAVPDTRAVLDKVEGVAEAVLEVAADPGRIGIVGLGTVMPHADAVALRAKLSPSELIDATELVEGLWCILSAEDRQEVAASHAAVALVFEAFRDALRPGRTEREIVAEAFGTAIRNGCMEGVIHLNHDTKSGTRPATARVVERDDIYKMFMEFLTPGGYLIELGGCFSFKPPPQEWSAKFDLVSRAIDSAIRETRPGMVADDLVALIRCEYERAGVSIIGRRLWDFHGQGMHSLLRPFGLPGSRDPIKTHMMINIHPGILTSDNLGISATSNYLVTENGGQPLGDFSHRWHVVG